MIIHSLSILSVTGLVLSIVLALAIVEAVTSGVKDAVHLAQGTYKSLERISDQMFEIHYLIDPEKITYEQCALFIDKEAEYVRMATIMTHRIRVLSDAEFYKAASVAKAELVPAVEKSFNKISELTLEFHKMMPKELKQKFLQGISQEISDSMSVYLTFFES